MQPSASFITNNEWQWLSVLLSLNMKHAAETGITDWRYEGPSGFDRLDGENHVTLNVSHVDQVNLKEGTFGWKKGWSELGLLVPAALVLQAWLTSAQPAHRSPPLPISTDGLRGASHGRKKHNTTAIIVVLPPPDFSQALTFPELISDEGSLWR